MTESPQYLEQFERVKRFYHRLEEINNGRVHDRSSDYYDDEFLSFFMNCYHLKDWIKNDDSVPQDIRNKVEPFINEHQCFHYCADIANGAKHLKLNHHRRINEDIKKGPRSFVVQLFEGLGMKPPIIQEKYSFLIGDQKVDGFTLATECLKKWEEFIQKEGLLIRM